ncbi:hypothetical protein L2E82_22699 [Cichorium intybus]|uniref:Uncharacterized protein n=1 Tax=Cichorium intybus TaxID=13427 RepID=A0ACB9DYA0_CICIN|nr:hypothetical protein L2E82_22699 [Cichorium intybus]
MCVRLIFGMGNTIEKNSILRILKFQHIFFYKKLTVDSTSYMQPRDLNLYMRVRVRVLEQSGLYFKNDLTHLRFPGIPTGFAIGNGLTDPILQYKAYTDYVLDIGIITGSQSKRVNLIVPVCEAAIKLCGTDGTVYCMALHT